MTESLNLSNLHHLVYGYIHESHLTIANEIIEIVRMYSRTLPEYSIKCMAATHLLALKIQQYLTDKRNTCEFSDELRKDVLKYVYVRGGALRDCCLSRKIKDIDIVVDVNTLSKKYLHHLKTYHSNSFNTKCIFYRHYLNQFKYPENMDISSQLFHPRYKFRTIGSISNDFSPANVDAFISEPDANKIYNYAARISNCDWVMNTRFFLDILLQSGLESNIHFECRQTNWTLILDQYYYHNIYLNNISFDFVDSSGHAYGQYQTLKQCQSSFGQFETDSVVAEIDEYYNYHSLALTNPLIYSNICIPIHPTKMNMVFYDFTINTLHISFDDILSNSSNKLAYIDFNWEHKVRKSDHNEKVINDANACGFKDIHSKILKAPYINVINKCTGNYFFWRLVKIAQKWITEIEKGVWKIDEKLLQCTINHYELWFDKQAMFTGQRNAFITKFINKFVNWNINCEQDINDRLRVFRYIEFEDRFKKLIIAQPNLINKIVIVCIPAIDIEKKIICAPFFKLFNKSTAVYYFLKFVETIQKYITQIQNKTWKIDEKYLQCIIDSYPRWFNCNHCLVMNYNFIRKFLWNGTWNKKYFTDRLKVFRHIKFEKHLQKLLITYPRLFEMINVRQCLSEFGYKIPLSIGRIPIKIRPISNVIEPYEYNISMKILSKNTPYKWQSKNKPIYKNSKMYKHCKFIYDDYILKNNYFFNENNLKLSEKIKKKWSSQKRTNTLKYKRRNDRKQNAKSITKFKRRYALRLQY